MVPGARVALVHDWLTGMRGGERCLEVLCELFPDAPLFTLLHVPGSVTPQIERRRIVTSFVQRLPQAATRYRYYLAAFPLAISRFDLSGYDLVVSMSHCVAKGVRVSPQALHLCYCFSPMRYVWDLSSDYFGPGHGLAARALGPPLAAALRRWDRRTAGVHRFVAISRHIADRIRRAYDRPADVIYPPVDVARFEIADAADDYYLVVGALVPYKRIDLAVGAANRLGRRLLVVGTGPEDARLRALAGPTVSFLGWRSDAEIARLYARCRALIFPAVEDFGITPLEAAAAGRPTIALARGGALETMVGLDAAEAPTAVFFEAQTVDALVEAIARFERAAQRFDAKALRARAESFDRAVFKQKLGDYITARWTERRTEGGVLKAHSRLVENLALAGDLFLIALCWVSAYAIRFHLMRVTDVPPFRDYALQLVPILIVWGIAFRTFDLYRPNRLGSRVSEWFDVAKASTLGALILVSIMTFVFRGYEYSRLVILLFLLQSIVAVSLARAALREGLRFARRHGYNLRYAIVVGGGEPAAEVLRVLNRRRDVGIFVLGLLSDKREVPENVRWLGGIEDVRAVLDRQQVDIVFIALPHADASRLTAVLSGIGDDPIAIHLVPDVFSLVPARGGVEEFEMIPFIHLRESRLYGWNRVLKRAFDLVFGGLALVAAAPVMLAITVALKLTSPGPVLYRQERMGVDGRRFRMLKFRTMRVNAEAETGPVWARADDPRRTAVGVFLRRTSLDELPQLINVLHGEMSLVGPRPERPSFVEEFRRRVPGYMLRHKVKAGITGWAQINGWRGNTSIERRIEYDLYYIERWSLGFDLKILLQTLWYGFRINRNAH